MRKFLTAVMVAMSLAAVCAGAAAPDGLKGDYVEARTASVFAGACHYNGELTTTGREAIMAWSVTAGAWGGVNLAGVRALAVVSSDENLSDANAERRSELFVDSAASEAQAAAFVKALGGKYAAALGRVVAVRRAAVSFKREGKSYMVSARGAAELSVEPMPDDACCRMPQMVWYAPLIPLDGRKVGLTRRASYTGGPAGDAWQRTGENGAFYGRFTL